MPDLLCSPNGISGWYECERKVACDHSLGLAYRIDSDSSLNPENFISRFDLVWSPDIIINVYGVLVFVGWILGITVFL